jgi:ABC-type lipoprotein export system ATPase subunit
VNKIKINKVLPFFISDADTPASEIWSKEVSFEKGTNYLISASSGAGKTSLFAYLFGERKDYRGDILFDERKIAALGDNEWNNIRRNKISHVFQGLRLFEGLTVFENIVLKNRLTGFKKTKEIKELLRRVGLSDKENEKVEHLSFGQQQRAAVIRALCQPFDFLLLDEPFSHLDKTNTEILSEIIREELQNRQAGMVLCSLGEEYSFDYSRMIKL